MATLLRALLVVLALAGQSASAAVCDPDGDTDIDRSDLGLIGAARGTSVGAGDARDADGDGRVTVIDGRICSQRCTRPGCAAGTPPPSANDDAYSAIGNVRISIPAGGVVGADDVLLNDILLGGALSGFGPVTGAETLPGSPGLSANGGNVMVNSNGSIDYNPPAGFEGADSFRYTLTSASGSDTATVTITVAGMIWFVDDGAGMGGNGRLTAPFACLVGPGCFSSSAPDDPGDNVFIFDGDYAGGLALLDEQSLIGQGASAPLATITDLVPPPGSDALPVTMSALRPALVAAVDNLVLGQHNRVRGLDVMTNGATGLSGTDFGDLEVSEVSVFNTNGVAIDLDTGNPAASFEEVSASGGANGIVLQNTTGSFAITGSGGTCTNADTSGCSGGTIANTTGADDSTTVPAGTGVVLNGASNVSLTRVLVHDHSNYGIRGTNVTGFALSHAVINGSNGTNAAGPFNEGSVRFETLTGVASVTSTHIQGGFTDNFRVSNDTPADLDRLTFSSVTIGTNSNPGGNDGISIESLPASTGALKVTIADSVFTAAAGDLFQYSHNGTGVGDLVITNSQFSNNHPTIASGGGGVSLVSDGNTTMAITGNSFRDALGRGVLIAKSATDSTTLGVSFDNNAIGVTGVANSGSREDSALTLQTIGGGALNAAVRSNTILGYNNHGIELLAGGGGSATSGNLHATITGNTVAEPGNQPGVQSFPKNGIHLNIGTTSGDSFSACAKIGGNGTTGNEKNSIFASGKDAIPPTLGDIDFRLRQRQSTTIRLPGYAGINNDNAAVVSFVRGNNDAGGTPDGTASNSVSTGGGGFVGGAACTLP